jgi:S-DNA-T family DNA segregation ATPase FtsK/SpoIIIE
MRICVLTDPEAQLEIEIEVEPGLLVTELRAHLVLLTGDGRWATGRLWVDDTPVDDDQPVGTAPVLVGAVLRRAPGPASPPVSAVRAGAHLAVLSGPGTGAVLPLPLGRTVLVPAGWAGGRTIRLRAHRRGVGACGRGLSVRRRPGPRRRRPHRWGPTGRCIVLRAGDQLRTTGWHGEVRREPAPRPRRSRRIPPARLIGLAAAVLGPALLALTTRHWSYLLLALAGPALLVGLPGPVAADAAEPTEPPALADVAALRVAVARRRLGSAQTPTTGAVPWGSDGTLLVTGSRAGAVGAALALLAVGAPPEVSLVVLAGVPEQWAWAVWLGATTTLPSADAAPTVVVAADPPDPGAVASWRAAGLGEHRLLVVTEDDERAPAWCTDRLTTTEPAALLQTAAGRQQRPEHGSPGPDLLRATARELAAIAARTADLPGQVALGELGQVAAADADQVAAGWARADPGLVVPLGRTGGGREYRLDLVRDGPHLLIGGTTGSGKSELLITLVIAAALAQPPARLAMLLVDFKGGTGVGITAALPHVLEHLSDLDATRAGRTLTALTAELRRRERLLAAAGATDHRDLDPDDARTPPRLLVVIDEFRALLDEVPAAGAVLARLAAQGRALGVHLVLATQRPAGAVGPDLRANVSARIALRVADPQDSTDLLAAPDAASIPRRTPGRALVRLGADPPSQVQLARATLRPARATVRPATRWPAGPAAWRPTGRTVDDTAAWVGAVRRAAADHARPAVPWLPELPAVVRADQVPAGPGLAVALADEPAELSRTAVRWHPAGGQLLVVGAPGTGRTTALVAVGTAALAAGFQVHAVGLPPAARAVLHRVDLDGRLGTVAGHQDVLVLARLLELLDDGSRTRRLLLVDGLEQVVQALGGLARGTGADRLTRLWTTRAGDGTGPALAASATGGPLVSRAAPGFADRLVLALRDPGAAAVLGVPSRMTVDGPPGRAVHLSDAGARLCQVVLVEPGPAPTAAGPRTGAALSEGAERPGNAQRRARDLPNRPEPPTLAAGPGRRTEADLPRLRRLPTRATSGPDEPVPTGVVALGLGGDQAGRVEVEIGPTFLVVGPPGSGRSTALRRFRRAAAAAGHQVLTAEVALDRSAEPGALDRRESPAEVLVLDDLDELESGDPALARQLEQQLVARRRSGLGAWVLAATCTEHAAAAFRGPTSLLVRERRLLVLDPCAPGSAELLGPRGGWLADPHARVPGRGVLRLGRDLLPIQVFDS